MYIIIIISLHVLQIQCGNKGISWHTLNTCTLKGDLYQHFEKKTLRYAIAQYILI